MYIKVRLKNYDKNQLLRESNYRREKTDITKCNFISKRKNDQSNKFPVVSIGKKGHFLFLKCRFCIALLQTKG